MAAASNSSIPTDVVFVPTQSRSPGPSVLRCLPPISVGVARVVAEIGTMDSSIFSPARARASQILPTRVGSGSVSAGHDKAASVRGAR